MNTYRNGCDVQDAAAQAMFRAIALYKAAGFSKQNLIDAPEIWWDQVPMAQPEEKDG